MRYPVALAVVAIAAVVAVAAAQGGGAAVKQRIVIDGGDAGFTLTPAGAGRLEHDGGSAFFCCWTDRTVVRDGQSVEVTAGPEMTLSGRLGTLVARNHMEWLDIKGGYQIFTGTWTVVRGTGAYAGVTGGGRVAGIKLPSGVTKWRRSGVLEVK